MRHRPAVARHRCKLLVLSAATSRTVGENCGGAFFISPSYCAGPLCDANAMQVGDSVPLRLRVTNKASYSVTTATSDDVEVGVPGVLKAGKRFQIMFACLDIPACSEASDVLEYDPVLGYDWHPDFRDAEATFEMGAAPGFNGNAVPQFYGYGEKYCGHITLTKDVRSHISPHASHAQEPQHGPRKRRPTHSRIPTRAFPLLRPSLRCSSPRTPSSPLVASS